MNADQIRLKEIHRKASAGYQSGSRDADRLVSREDVEFLSSLGITSQVLLDYVEDFVRSGEPDCATFVRVVEIRRDYFLKILRGVPAERVVLEPELPLREDEWEGVAWLPRITQKARCLLEGSLCKDVMYGCSGDRAFLRKFQLTLPGFLEKVRDSGGAPSKLLDFVRGA